MFLPITGFHSNEASISFTLVTTRPVGAFGTEIKCLVILKGQIFRKYTDI